MTDHTCHWPECETPIAGRVWKWCDAHRIAKARSYSPDTIGKQCSAADCDRPLRARGFCNMHYKQVLRSEGRITEQPWNDRRRNNAQARRARMLGARTGGSVFLADVRERDGDGCALCFDPIDFSLAFPHPLSKSVDHIIPLSKGGPHDPSNCQLAHLICNTAKGAKVA